MRTSGTIPPQRVCGSFPQTPSLLGEVSIEPPISIHVDADGVVTYAVPDGDYRSGTLVWSQWVQDT